MKINENFVLREIAGENILVPCGKQAQILDGMIVLNPAGAVIWEALCEKTDETYVLKKLLEAYAVCEKEAAQDLKEFLEVLKEKGLLTDEEG